MTTTSRFAQRIINAALRVVVAAGFALPLIPSVAHAASDDTQYWNSIILSGNVTDTAWGWKIETYSRYSNQRQQAYENVFDPSITYTLKDGPTLSLGFYTKMDKNLAKNEDQLWEQYQQKWNFDGYSVALRWRQEQRHFKGVSDTAHRSRLQVKGTFANLQFSVFTPFVSEEVLYYLNSAGTVAAAGFVQNRAFAGVSAKATDALSFDIAYGNILNHTTAADLTWHVCALTANYRF